MHATLPPMNGMIGMLVRVFVLSAACPANSCPDVFRAPCLVRMTIDLSDTSAESLRKDPRSRVPATITVDGSRPAGVRVHLKGGAGSFRPFDDKPSFTVRLDQGGAPPPFGGLGKIHLNNSVQDSSYLCEDLAGELFRRAGVPAPRTAWAVVTVNGRSLGLYVIKEGFTKGFLREHFGDARGNFYDSGRSHSEITHALELRSGRGPDHRSDLEELACAASVSDPAARWSALGDRLDVPRFVSFMAMEVMTGHSDGYCLMQNNYRVYFGSRDGRAVFLPHGTDRMFGDPTAPLEPTMKGLVADAFMRTPKGRALYLRRVAELSREVFQSGWILERSRTLARLLEPVDAVAARDARLTGERAAARAEFIHRTAHAGADPDRP